jgi:cell division septation protein DedD
MLRIIPHLEHLLKTCDCVILPQLGGFVLQSASALYVAEEGLFRPMHKDVVFNAGLKYNDGLLAEKYMDAYGVSFQRAYRMLEEDVEEIKSLLFRELRVSLGNVGTLRRGTEGQIIFQSGDAEIFSIESYGLSAFRIKAWEDLQRESEASAPTKKNTYYIPVNRSILHGVASAAAAIALFLMISTPVKEINPSSYTASFIPAEIVKTASPNKDKAALPVAVQATATAKTTTLSASAPSTRKSTEKAAVKLPVYYVVIGSVKTKKQADELTLKAERTGIKNVSKVIVSDKIRVYADKFTDKGKAEAYLAKIKQTPKYQDAWLYTRNK